MTPDPLDRLLGGPDPPAGPRREFADALLDRLLATLADGADGRMGEHTDRRAAVPLTGVGERPVRVGERRVADSTTVARRRPVWFATAALVVVALAVAYVAVRLDRSDRPTTVPAVIVPATATPAPTAVPGVAERELLEVEIPAEAVPAGRASVSLHHLTLPPGVRTLSPAGHNVHLRYLVSGVLTVRADGPARLSRAGGDGAWESVPADVEVTLGPGDAVLFLALAEVEYANPGTDGAEVMAYGLTLEGAGGPWGDLSGWIVNDYAESGREDLSPGDGVVLPGQPAVVRLSRVVLEPRATMPAPPADRFRLAVALFDNELGTPVVPRVSMPVDGRVGNTGATSVTLYGVTLEIPTARGTPLAGDQAP